MSIQLIMLLYLLLVLSVVVLIITCIFTQRFPHQLFNSPIKSNEFKILLEIMMNSNWKVDYPTSNSYFFNDDKFHWKQDFYTDKWTLNGQRLSLYQERKINRLIIRRKLNTNILTKAGKILYTKNT